MGPLVLVAQPRDVGLERRPLRRIFPAHRKSPLRGTPVGEDRRGRPRCLGDPVATPPRSGADLLPVHVANEHLVAVTGGTAEMVTGCGMEIQEALSTFCLGVDDTTSSGATRDLLESIAMSDAPGSRPIYSIGAVSRMLGVPVPTLRSWEERYGIVRPERSEGGQRLFSRDQVEQLRFITEQVESGLNPADAHRLLEERLGVVPAARASHRLVILLAERDPYAAEFSEYFLRTEGYDVVLAFEAEDTQRAFEERSPDLTVVEWLISGGAGAAVVADLKARSDRPVLVISPLAMRDAAVEAGADAFLIKPLDALQLVSTVKDLLGESAFIRPRDGARP